ncbi:rubredoxin-NAD(+) reductase [Sulfuriferula multivorans]|uniref:Rubredoxin-NAD(+) reductase n=1 Tax=Sulfuriferula multivorans TaxID=1559896 RepID=A0A401JGF2_9PROT|nr:FAD-dependent oxidoreductase [Sulfuriferula multivorans]GBL46721.1 rubredoxin-NAD(+) reductase [Sulfuriferula multivorans]
MEPIVIIGSGLAGYTLARELRKLDQTVPLVIITADDGRYYSKPLLSNALAQGKTADQLAGAFAPAMAEQLNAEVLVFSRVEEIDPVARSVRVAQRIIAYSKLVLALGADPVRPLLAGDATDSVLSVNDLMDYARFRERITGARRVTILGGGLIGCEFANDLSHAGHQVDIVHPALYPLDRLLPEAAAQDLQRGLAGVGVTWHLGHTATAVNRAVAGYAVTLDDGAVIATDAVLAAIGLRPRVTLAQAAGIRAARGIQVNRLLETSVADVYALGDCAEVAGHVLPYVMPLMAQARALAATLAGTPTEVVYPAMPVIVKTPACPVAVATVAGEATGSWQVACGEEGVCALYQDEGQGLLGFALTGKQAGQRQALAKRLPALLP